MSTIDSRHVIDEIIAADGYIEGDPRVAMIVEYETVAGKTTWGVTWEHESPSRQRRYLTASYHVRNPRVLWTAGGVL